MKLALLLPLFVSASAMSSLTHFDDYGVFLHDVEISKENTPLATIRYNNCNFVSQAIPLNDKPVVKFKLEAFSCPNGYHYVFDKDSMPEFTAPSFYHNKQDNNYSHKFFAGDKVNLNSATIDIKKALGDSHGPK